MIDGYSKVPTHESAPPAYVPSAASSYGTDPLLDGDNTSHDPTPSSSAQPYAATPAPCAHVRPRPSASNNLSIIHKNGSIKGEWTIDTSKVVPSVVRGSYSREASFTAGFPMPGNIPSLFVGLADSVMDLTGDRKGRNAFFGTSDGSVNATLFVKGGGLCEVEVVNKGHAANGVKLRIADRDPSTKLAITITTSSNIKLSLPSDFNGLLKGGSERGRIKFSPALQSRVATFAVDQNNPAGGRYFIGNYNEASSEGGEEENDVLNLKCEGHSSGGIYIDTWDEHEAAVAERKPGFEGWIGRVGSELGTCLMGCGPFCKNGEKLPDGSFLAYKTWGDVSKPAIVYPTWYGGSIALNEWLIGTDQASLNPDKFFIVVPALFGNGQSSSPSNNGGKYPHTTMLDNVRAQYLLLQHLGVTKLYAAVGWSMGAAQSFQWAVAYPDFVERIVPFCGAARVAHHNVAFLRSLIMALQLDPKFKDGQYGDDPPKEGLKVFAAIYASWAGLSQAFYRKELFKPMGFETRDDFFLKYYEPKFAGADANNTTTPGHSWSHDAKDGRSSEEAFTQALASIKAKTLVMPSSSDLYFPPEDSEFEVAHIPGAKLDVIPSDFGHGAGGSKINVVDNKYIDSAIGKFFAKS
ncbi:homoserine acetyltransferase family protein [Pseudohyphozyma bogoriensis]|nr:homoserine acetyltransferase family protein [Pseudohyphozyma bogoriensis]